MREGARPVLVRDPGAQGRAVRHADRRLLRLDAAGVAGILRIARSIVPRHPRISAVTPLILDPSTDRQPGRQPIWRNALFSPIDDSRERIDLAWSVSTPAMRHTRDEEEPI